MDRVLADGGGDDRLGALWVAISRGRWAAIAIIIMLQGYLMLGSSPAGRVADDQPVEVAQSSADRAAS